MNKRSGLFGWIVTIVLLLFSLVGFERSLLSGILFLLCALICCPLRAKILKLKKFVVVIIAAVLFLAGCYVFPTAENKQHGDVVEIPVQQTVPEAKDEDNTIEVSEPEQDPVDPEESQSSDVSTESLSGMEVHFIDVGQGDSTLIVCDGEAMLIDAGDDSKGTTVQYYLKKHGVDRLKYVIATHPDSDHIGGLNVILYKFDCETILMTDVTNDTAAYRDVVDTLKEKNYKTTLPVVGDTYTLGSASFTILGPVGSYEDTNNSSIAIRLTHGENSFIFTGDAESEAEYDFVSTGMDLHANVLKVGHHGSHSSTSDRFLDAVRPDCAVISCGVENSYGHPHTETMMKLKERNCLVYRTDEQGSIVAVSNGTTLTWNCAPSETWGSGSSEGSDESAEAYILNIDTGEFHDPDCTLLLISDEKSLKKTETSREILVVQGYKPCENCRPQ